jgi:hypothetical protein
MYLVLAKKTFLRLIYTISLYKGAYSLEDPRTTESIALAT